jgi:hypothetical protein
MFYLPWSHRAKRTAIDRQCSQDRQSSGVQPIAPGLPRDFPGLYFVPSIKTSTSCPVIEECTVAFARRDDDQDTKP